MLKIVNNLVQGGQPNLSGRIISRLLLKLPPIKEQQKIAKILSASDSEIEILQKQLPILKD